MITDGIEVQLQERLHPELLGTMSTPFARAGKAFLLPQGSELTRTIDAWVAAQLESGELAELLARAVAEKTGTVH
jgi:ABC-type amino acid transport substrate-binding protein